MTAPAPKPCPFCLWQPDERFIQLPRNWVEHTSVGDCVLKGMAFPIEQWNSRAHYSDCAVHNDPAYNNGECTCDRPQQSAEPVAWRAFRKDAAFKCYIYWEENPVDSLAEDEIYGPVQSLYLAASPGSAELVEEMEKLEAEMRDMASEVGPRVLALVHPNWVADRLSALITRHRGKS